MWKKPNLKKLNFFLGFFSPSNLDFFFWKNNQIQICFFLFQKKKPNSNYFFCEIKKTKVEGGKKPRKNLVFSNLVFFTWTDLISESIERKLYLLSQKFEKNRRVQLKLAFSFLTWLHWRKRIRWHKCHYRSWFPWRTWIQEHYWSLSSN